jgi:hypothetical protein
MIPGGASQNAKRTASRYVPAHDKECERWLLYLDNRSNPINLLEGLIEKNKRKQGVYIGGTARLDEAVGGFATKCLSNDMRYYSAICPLPAKRR